MRYGGFSLSVEFVTGRPGAEADAYINRRIGEMLKEDPVASIPVITPRQSTFETASEIFRANGMPGSLTVQVISPRTFANHVLDEVYGSAVELVDTAGKSMAIRRILDENREKMRAFARIGAGHKLPTLIAKQISQLRMMDITPEELGEYAADEGNTRLADLASIFADLPDFLGTHRVDISTSVGGEQKEHENERLDADDQMDLAIYHIAQSPFVRNARAVIFRGFSSYSEQMIRLMQEVMKAAPETIVVFPTAPEGSPDAEVYRATADAMHRLTAAALPAPNVKRMDDEEAAHAPEDILHASRALFSHRGHTKLDSAPSMRIAPANRAEQEIRAVAAEVARLHRDEGIPFSRMAVVWGETSAYEVLVRRIFGEAHIPYFTDEQKSLAQSNLAEFILTAAEMTSGQLKKDSVLAHIATGFTELSAEEQSALQNYGQSRIVRGREFEKEFRKNDPREFLDDFDTAEGARQKVMRAVTARLREPLRNGKETDAGVVFEALENYINDVLRPERVEYKAVDLGARYEQASFMEQTYRTAVSIVSQAKDMLAGTRLGPGDARRILQAGFEAVMLSVVPAGVDEVQAGPLGGFRVPEVDALFVVGVNDEVLPKFTDTSKDILTPREWTDMVLKVKGINIPSDSEEQKFLIVEAIRQAKKHIQWSYSTEGGQMPSVLIQYLDELFEGGIERVDPEEQALFLKQNAYDFAVRQVRAKADGIPLEVNRKVSMGVLGDEEFTRRTDTLKSSLGKSNAAVPAEPLYKPKRLSATQLSTYFSCPYQHFMQYQIGAWVPREAALDNAEAGSYMHGVLRRISDKARNDRGFSKWSDVDDVAFSELVDEALDEEIEERMGYEVDPRTSAVLQVLSPEITRAAESLRNQYAQGAIAGIGSEMPFTVLDGNVQGIIDRLDAAFIDGRTYYSVVDYKSRLKDFSIESLIAGTDLQLALYLLAVEEMIRSGKMQNGILLDPAGAVAGAGFINTFPGFASVGEEWWKAHEWWKDYRMRGLVAVPANIAERIYGIDDPNATGHQLYTTQVRTSQGGTAYHSMDAGARVYLPGSDQENGLDALMACTKTRVVEGGDAIRAGKNDIMPFRSTNENACRYCDFRSICGFDEQQPGAKVRRLPKPEGGYRALLSRELSKGEDE